MTMAVLNRTNRYRKAPLNECRIKYEYTKPNNA